MADANAQLQLLLLEKEKRRRAGGGQPSAFSEVAGNVAGTALETLGAPDQLAGEAVRVAREGYPLRLPQVAQRIPLVRDIDNRYVTAQKPPSSFVGEVASGIQGVAQGAIAPLRGADPLQTAAQEIARPKNTLPDAVMQTGLALAGGPVMNAPMDAAAKGIAAVAKPVGQLAAMGSSVGTAVPPKDYAVVFKNPGAIMPGRFEKAGEAFEREAVKLGAGIKGVPTKERISAMRNSEKYAFDLYEDLTGGKPVDPGRALLGRQALDKITPQKNDKNGTYLALLDKMRDAFQDVIAKAPEMQKVSKEYSIAKSGEKFLSAFPRTSTGKPGFVRGAAMLEMARRGQYGMTALGIPALAGGVTAAAGAGAQLLSKIAKNDPLKAALLAAYLNKRGQ